MPANRRYYVRVPIREDLVEEVLFEAPFKACFKWFIKCFFLVVLTRIPMEGFERCCFLKYQY